MSCTFLGAYSAIVAHFLSAYFVGCIYYRAIFLAGLKRTERGWGGYIFMLKNTPPAQDAQGSTPAHIAARQGHQRYAITVSSL